MKLIIHSLIFILFSSSAQADLKKFLIQEKWETFEWNRKDRISVNHLCRNSRCQALQKLKQASFKGIDQNQDTNLGALVCRKLGGKSLLGIDSKKNQNSFCRFSDQSLIDNGTLHYYALKNDGLLKN